jgi:hypothetical protein
MPTAARQKYLAKQAAKQADRFTDADRQGEYDKVFSQLSQISDPEVDKFEALMSEWVKDGRVRQGVIPVPRIRRAIVYSLGISRSKTFVSLRSDEPEKYINATTETVNTEASASNTNITHQQETNNTTTSTDEVYEDAVEEIPELVPTTIPSTETPSSTPLIPPAEQTKANVVNTSNLSKNAKKKKQQVFAQSAPRGSRHASRPPPAMKPKAQSA